MIDGILWMASGAGLQALVHLVALAALARLLTPEDFGIVTAALVVLGLADVRVHLGIGEALIQRVELEPRHIATGFLLTMGSGIVLLGLVVAVAPFVATFFQMPRLTPVLWALSLSLPLASLATVSAALLQRELRFKLVARIEAACHLVGYGFVGVALAWAGFGVWALVGAHLTRVAVSAVLYLALAPHPVRFSVDRSAARDLIHMGGGFTFIRWANYAAFQADNLVVGRFLGAVALGVYSRAYQLMTIPASLLGQAAERVLFAAMSQMQGSPRSVSLAFLRATRVVAITVLPASVLTFLLAREIVQVVLGPQWDAVVPVLRVFSIVMIARTSFKLSASFASARGLPYAIGWRQVVYAVAVLVGALVGQRGGLPWVAVGVSCAILLNFALMTQLTVSISTVTWLDIARAHRRALALTAATAVIALPALMAAGLLELGAVATLVVTVGGVGTAASLCLRFRPHWVLGEEEALMKRMLRERFPRTGSRPDGDGGTGEEGG